MAGEKTEQPTDKKLRDAKEDGNVAMSRDLAKLATLVVVAEIAFMAEPMWRGAIESLMTLSFLRIGQPFPAAMAEMLTATVILLAIAFGLFFVVCTVVAFASHWGQFGPMVSFKAITPKLDKLDPVNGFKQLFSKRKLIELVMSLLKSSLIGILTYMLIRDQLSSIIHLSSGEPKDVYFGFITLLREIFHIIITLCLLMAAIDFVIQKQVHTKGLMMSMEDIKNEHKESEGDPMVKGQRKQLARQWAMEEPVNKTSDANAVVVNPTHFAVAMFYDGRDTPVPVVLAKGKDEVAQAMIRRAKECGIPVIRHVWLARTLYASCRPDTVIPKSSYQAAAYVYAVVRELHANNEVDRVVELESYGDPPESHRG